MDPSQPANQPPAAPAPAGPEPPIPPPADGSTNHMPSNIYPTPRDTRWSGVDVDISPAANPISASEAIPPPPPPVPHKKGKREGWRSIAGTISLLILAPLIALAITAFGFQSYQVDGASMETTLSSGDRLIVNKIPRTLSRVTKHPYVPKRGEVVIFNHPSFGQSGGPQKQLIKRVVGLPGETVLVAGGNVIVMNADSPDGFEPDISGDYKIKLQSTPGEIEASLGEDEIFVVGDNRSNSEDSRYFGPVKLDKVVGVLSVRIMPFDKLQKF